MEIIISGFATCGKSILDKKYKNVIDLESSPFKNIMRTDLLVEEQKRNKKWVSKFNLSPKIKKYS